MTGRKGGKGLLTEKKITNNPGMRGKGKKI